MTISSLSLFLSFSLFFALSLYPLHVFAISLPLPFGFPCPPQTPRHFEVGEKGEDASRIFSVPDFVGDACKAIASRVRGAVAGVQFDDFHKARHIRFSKPQTARSPQDEFMLWCCGDGNITVDTVVVHISATAGMLCQMYSQHTIISYFPSFLLCSCHSHQNSAKIIRASVFGMDEKGKVRDRFCFPANSLVVTSIDIQSVEPVDQRTRDALQKSVQLAIEITTNSQEAAARSAKEKERRGGGSKKIKKIFA